MTETTTTQETTGQSNPFDRTILLSVTVRTLGVSRKVSTNAIEVDSDKTLLRVSKRILECPEYAAIHSTVGLIKKYLRSQAVPGVKFIKSGIYPLPVVSVPDVDAKITELIGQFNGKVARFLEVYEARCDEARGRLNVLGNLGDYPALDKVGGAFGIETEYVTIGPPASLQEISKEIWRREQAKAKTACLEAVDQVKLAMRQMFAELVGHMVDRLTPAPDGKKKIFKESLIGGFKDFIGSFSARNVADDAELQGLVEQAQNILAGKTVETLRRSDDTRGVVLAGMASVKSSLDAMLVDKPSRAISFD